MNRTLFSLLILVFGITSLLNAQSLTLSNKGNDVSNGELNIQGNASDDELKVVLNITNTGSSSINVKAKKRVLDDIDGSENTFCLVYCYDPSATESNESLLINAGATTGSDDFYTLFIPNGSTGVAKILYDVYNVDNTDDAVSITVYYHIYPTSVPTNTRIANFNVYPNPTNGSSANITYNLPSLQAPSKLVLYNLLGVKVYEILLTQLSGKEEVDISNFPKGIYFYTIESNGFKSSTKKLIVK